MSVDFVCDWISYVTVTEYSSDVICNAFVCQYSVCIFIVDIPTNAICMRIIIKYFVYNELVFRKVYVDILVIIY